MKIYTKTALLLLMVSALTAGEATLQNIKQYDTLVKKNAEKCGIDADLISALITVESNWNAQASYKGCNGLMQVKGGSFEPDKNIRSGCSILAKAYRIFGDIPKALLAYNKGVTGAKRHIRQGGKINTKYVTKIMTIYKRLKLISRKFNIK